MSSSYKATHVPYGISDASKRTIRNPGIQDEVEFKKYGIETGGEYFLTQVLVKPGGGVHIHRHASYGETFIPVEGDLGVVGHHGTKTMILSSANGETYTVKPGEWHKFFDPSKTETIVFEVKIQPAHQGFEKMLHIFYGLVEDGHGTPEGFPQSTFHLLMLTNMGEMRFPGVGGWISSWIAAIAGLVGRWTGEEERLVQRYYGKPISDNDKRKWKVA